jgi:pimeloyl-ACP methyl ester carboxylesterase
MPRATATDGTELHWEERGSGPTVLLVAHWSLHPMLWGPLIAELEGDHRIVRYDDRGTGESDRNGPYDLETSADDLETIAEVAGGAPMIAVGLMDGENKAVRVAARRPDLISHVISSGGSPLSRRQQLETDYRAALRGIVEGSNPDMPIDEVRARVSGQAEHVPMEVASVRVREWAEDEGSEAPGRELGDRLVILLSDNITGGWWPGPAAMKPLLASHFPEAVVKEIDDGIISRPDLTASYIRQRSTADIESVP